MSLSELFNKIRETDENIRAVKKSLEKIEQNLNPSRKIFPSPPNIEVIKIASDVSVGVHLTTDKPFLVYGGMQTSAGIPVISPSGIERITYDSDTSIVGKSFGIYPGSIIGTLDPQGKKRVIFFDTTTSQAGGHYTFYGVNHPSDASVFVPPFRLDSGTVRWASLDAINYDQYVLFRATPTVNIGTMPAVTATIQEPISVDIDGTTKTVTRTSVSFNTTGNNTLVGAAGASTKIKVLGLFLFASAATNVIIQSGAGGTALIGQCNLAANQGFVLPTAGPGFHWCQTADNTLLNCNQSGTAQIGGVVVHINEA